jgi:uncharacterized membrane protein YsdA (DUF1294 family)/cold shock CspA family protein
MSSRITGMRFQGRLTEWRDEKGYGFITPNGGGARVFVHRTDFASGRRPRGNELVTYELEVDDRRRPNARNVQYVSASSKRGLPAIGAIAAPMLAVVFLAYLTSGAAGGKLPWLVPAWYVGLSLLTYLFYRQDKAASIRGGWRTPEKQLHGLAVLGGWPGALVAQRWLRHKSTKTSFLVTFLATVVVNISAVVWLHTAAGAKLLSRIVFF